MCDCADHSGDSYNRTSWPCHGYDDRCRGSCTSKTAMCCVGYDQCQFETAACEAASQCPGVIVACCPSRTSDAAADCDPGPACSDPKPEYAEIRVIRKPAPCSDERVTLISLLKYTKRLMFMLDEFRQEMSAEGCCATMEHRDAVVDLAHRVQWFVKDVELSDGARDQLCMLLECYERYRKLYHGLRDAVDCYRKQRDDGGKCAAGCEIAEAASSDGPAAAVCCTCSSVHSAAAAQPSSTSCGKCETPLSLGCAERARKDGKGLTECPGVLDVTKDMDSTAGKTVSLVCIPVQTRKPREPSAMDELRTWFKGCMCFPCRCAASLSIANK